jgi:amidase
MGEMSNPELDRRTFLGGAAAAAGALIVPASLRGEPRRVAVDLVEITLSELADGLATGRWTAHSLVAACLARIEALDRDGPGLNSILELNPDALAVARSLAEERAVTGPRSRLHGIPILVKDSIGTADRMHTSAGSLALADYIAPHDATVIEKLRQAGCIIIGKANMSEWSNARGRASIAGWSARGQLTLNPYSLNRSAGGSSSGSAAAVAASLVPAALGVETMGSIVSPAAMCGIVGMKPTVGLVSRRGIIPVSSTQDTAGPMCRTVRDAAMLLSVIAGPDPLDPVTLPAGEKGHADYTRFLDPNGLKGARIGVARNLFGLSYGADRVMERALIMLRSGGATVVDPADIESADGIMAFDREVLAFELKAALAAYFADAGAAAPVRDLADIIEFNNRNSDLVMKWFGQETFLYAQAKGPLSSPAYQRDLMLVRRFARDEGIDATLAKHRLDAIVAPTQSPAWLTDMLLGDNTFAGGFAAAAAAGYPSITVPAGDVAGLPVGLLFMGAAWSEPTLFRLAFAFEQLAQGRRTPEFLPSLTGRR